jgi:hypothetical protein
LLVLALAYALDLVSVVGRGNLAGLFTMIAAGPSLALLGVVLAARLTAPLLARWRRGRDETGHRPEPVPEGIDTTAGGTDPQVPPPVGRD